jgi:hypothetical protein
MVIFVSLLSENMNHDTITTVGTDLDTHHDIDQELKSSLELTLPSLVNPFLPDVSPGGSYESSAVAENGSLNSSSVKDSELASSSKRLLDLDQSCSKDNTSPARKRQRTDSLLLSKDGQDDSSGGRQMTKKELQEEERLRMQLVASESHCVHLMVTFTLALLVI